MFLNRKESTHPPTLPAFSLQINLSDSTTRWLIGIITTVGLGGGVISVVQPQPHQPTQSSPSVSH